MSLVVKVGKTQSSLVTPSRREMQMVRAGRRENSWRGILGEDFEKKKRFEEREKSKCLKIKLSTCWSPEGYSREMPTR